MNKLRELSISELIDLYNECDHNDEEKILSIIEKKTGILLPRDSDYDYLWAIFTIVMSFFSIFYLIDIANRYY